MATATAARSSRDRSSSRWGYIGCIEATVALLPAFAAIQKMLKGLRDTGNRTRMMEADMVRARKDVEDLIRLEEYYANEAETVEGD